MPWTVSWTLSVRVLGGRFGRSSQNGLGRTGKPHEKDNRPESSLKKATPSVRFFTSVRHIGLSLCYLFDSAASAFSLTKAACSTFLVFLS